MTDRPREGVDDRALMERIRNECRDALRILVERHWSSLVSYVTRIVGGRDEAKDVVQDVFIQVWRKRESWSSTGSPSAYLYRISRNLALNAVRDRDARERRDEGGGERLARSGRIRGPDERLAADSLRDEVWTAIDTLSERRREVFILSRFHGLTHREIADTLGVSSQTVSNQMTAALSHLRDLLAHHVDER